MAEPIRLCDTAGMDEVTWQACRMHGPKGDIPYTVGGSDVATIFGVSPWMTALELWRVKKGLMEVPEKANPKKLRMGHLLEPVAAQLYADETGDTVINDTWMYQHPNYKYALANFDRRYIRKKDGKEGILECKSTSYHKADDWACGAYPLNYEHQLRFYLAVADREIGNFAALWGNDPETDFVYPGLKRDLVKEGLIFEKLDYWIWSLKNDKPPAIDNTVAPKLALEALAKIYAGNKSAPELKLPKTFEDDVKTLLSLQGRLTEQNRLVRELEAQIMKSSIAIAAYMKEYEHAVLETTTDKLLIDYVEKSRETVDKKKLKSLYPDVYDEVCSVSRSRKVKVETPKVVAVKATKKTTVKVAKTA